MSEQRARLGESSEVGESCTTDESKSPAEWREVSIIDLCEIGGGITPKKSNSEYWGGDILWTTPKDFDGPRLFETENKITKKGVEETTSKIYPPGTVLMVVRSGVLRHTLPVMISERDTSVNQDLKALEPHTREINAEYFFQALTGLSEDIRGSCKKTGTTVESIQTNVLEQYPIPVPPLEEQRKIASVLYTVDQAIQKTEDIINQVNLVQAGLTSHLFTSGPRDSETTDRRLGPVATQLPAHWETKTIGELYTDRQLGTGERGSSDDGTNIDLIKMGNLGFGTWDFSELEKIDPDPKLLEECGLEIGDLLFNTRNTPELVGKTAVWEYDREAIYDNNLLRLRFGDRITSGHYVNYYLTSELGRRQLRSCVHGTTSVAAIYWSNLKKVTIPVPPTEEQTEIVDVLRTHDEVRRRNESYQSGLQSLKQGLMQDLLSGEVRTHDKDIDIVDDILAHG